MQSKDTSVPVEPWRVLDVGAWPIEQHESRGKRPKVWVRDPTGVLWLRKNPRAGRPSEPAIEAMMLRLAAAIGVPSAEGHVCTWSDDERGLAARLFNAPEEELSLGVVELSATEGYDPERHEMHTLDRMRATLLALEEASGVGLLRPFLEMLAFDAAIGNGDRHQENWGILRRAGVPTRLAPMFDPAACLGTELQDGHATLQPDAPLDRYMARCPSGFGDGKRLLGMVDVLAALDGWPEWPEILRSCLARTACAMDTLQQVIGQIPPEWLSQERAAFACRLLRARLEWLARRSSG